MKKALLALVIVIIFSSFVGCQYPTSPEREVQHELIKRTIQGVNFVYDIDQDEVTVNNPSLEIAEIAIEKLENGEWVRKHSLTATAGWTHQAHLELDNDNCSILTIVRVGQSTTYETITIN